MNEPCGTRKTIPAGIKRSLRFSWVFFFFLASCSGPEKSVVYDFIREFPSAQKSAPVDKIEPLDLWNKSYQQLGWARNKKFEKKGLLIPGRRRNAFLRFSSLGDGDKTLVFQAKPLVSVRSAPPPAVQIFLNGEKIYSAALDWKGYRRLESRVKGTCFSVGENYLEFRLDPASYNLNDKFWFSLASVEFPDGGNFSGPGLPPGERKIGIVTKSRLFRKKRGIEMPLGTALGYFLKIPKRSTLRFAVSLETKAVAAPAGEKLRVVLETASGGKKTLWEQEVKPEDFPVEIDLSPYHDQISKVTFASLGGARDGPASPRLMVWEPRIISAPPERRPEKARGVAPPLETPFNILIYLVDCLRPDHLPFFGYEKNTAPHMEEFSRQGIVFRNAYAQGSWTRPSVGALFTGLYPFLHRAINLKSGLGSEFTTLAEVLQEKGFYTIGISSNAGIKEFFNFHQGFSSFKYHPKQDNGSSSVLNEYAFSELRKKKMPFFLYIHTMDAHRPYMIADEFKPDMPSVPPEKRRMVPLNRREKGGDKGSLVDLDRVIAQYDATISQNDKSFGDLIREMKELGLYDRTLIILMSDHGDEFYDHGGFAHGSTLYQEVLRQLLVIKLPGQVLAGREIRENVQEIDIFPTLLDLLGEPLPDFLLGRSMKDLLFHPATVERPFHDAVFAETREDLVLKSMIDGRWKIIHRGKEWTLNPKEYELYDLQEDPSEKENLIYRNPVATHYLMSKFKRWVENQKLLAHFSKEGLEKELTEKEIEELKALGYIR